MRNRVSLVCVVALLAACGGDPAAEPEVLHASRVDAPATLAQLLEIGCTACGSGEQLSIRSLDAGYERHVLVLDRFEPFVRVFDESGHLARSFGVHGEGPGELTQPSHVYAGRRGRIYVLDRRARRLIRYAEDGQWEREWKLPHFPYSPVLDPDAGRLVFASQHEALRRGESAVYAFDLDSGTVTPVVSFGDGYPTDHEGEASVYYPIAVDSPRSIAIGDRGNGYRVRIFDSDGVESRSCTLAISRTAKNESELAREHVQIARERIRFTPDPLKLHYYSWALAFDRAGRLWVRAGRSDTENTYFDVFEAGRYIGAVQAPPGIAERERYAIRGARLVAKYTNDAGEDVVRVFQIASVSD